MRQLSFGQNSKSLSIVSQVFQKAPILAALVFGVSYSGVGKAQAMLGNGGIGGVCTPDEPAETTSEGQATRTVAYVQGYKVVTNILSKGTKDPDSGNLNSEIVKSVYSCDNSAWTLQTTGNYTATTREVEFKLGNGMKVRRKLKDVMLTGTETTKEYQVVILPSTPAERQFNVSWSETEDPLTERPVIDPVTGAVVLPTPRSIVCTAEGKVATLYPKTGLASQKILSSTSFRTVDRAFAELDGTAMKISHYDFTASALATGQFSRGFDFNDAKYKFSLRSSNKNDVEEIDSVLFISDNPIFPTEIYWKHTWPNVPNGFPRVITDRAEVEANLRAVEAQQQFSVHFNSDPQSSEVFSVAYGAPPICGNAIFEGI